MNEMKSRCLCCGTKDCDIGCDICKKLKSTAEPSPTPEEWWLKKPFCSARKYNINTKETTPVKYDIPAIISRAKQEERDRIKMIAKEKCWCNPAGREAETDIEIGHNQGIEHILSALSKEETEK